MEVTSKRRITVDIRKNNKVAIPSFVQGDTNVVEFEILDNGVAADLSTVGKVVANYKRPDKHVVTREAAYAGNIVSYRMGQEEMEVAGLGEVEVQFFNADYSKRVSTFAVRINVAQSVGEAAELSDELGNTLLQDLLVKADYAEEQAKQAEAAAKSAVTNWLSPVANKAAVDAIAGPKLGDTVQTNDNGFVYRYDGTKWVKTQEYGATALANVNAQLAETAEVVLNIKKFLQVPETEYTAAVKRALTASPNATVIDFPSGEFIVNDVELRSNVTIRGTGSGSTFIKRNTDKSIFKANGTAYPTVTGGMPSIMNITFQDIQFSSVGNFQTNLLHFQGCSDVVFFRVKFDAYNCRLVYFNQVWDSRFLQCVFWHGGRTDGTPALELAGGENGYKQTMEVQMNNCWFEGYFGPAIRTFRPPNNQWKTNTLLFSNIKFESKSCTGYHLDLEVSGLMFNNVYVTTEFTSNEVVRMKNCRSIMGDIRFYYVNSASSNKPSAFISLDENCFLAKLKVLVSEPQSSDMNVVTMANPLESTIDIEIIATYPLVNNTNIGVKTIRKSTVRQVVDQNTPVLQYSFSKAGHPEWIHGNPVTDGTNYDFFFRADNTNFFTLRSKGKNPATSDREFIFGSQPVTGGSYDSPNILRVGTFYIWTDTNGDIRFKSGKPTFANDGWVFGKRFKNAISSPPNYVGEEALANGHWYKAVGTATLSDWKQITN